MQQDTLPTPLRTMEHTDRHPILSFISALFWVLCGSPTSLSGLNSDRTNSVLAIMGQGPGGIGHYQCPTSHLLFTVLFNDTHSLSRPYPV
jgi:hypothetical protein